MIISPIIVTTIAIRRYALLYNEIRDFIFSLSFSAIGLYNEKTIAEPIPNSVKESTPSTLENKPDTPRYSAPST